MKVPQTAQVSIRQAKIHLSNLVARAAAGEEIIINKVGSPVARLVPFHETRRMRVPGLDRGKVWIADDFDAPLPHEIRKLFE